MITKFMSVRFRGAGPRRRSVLFRKPSVWRVRDRGEALGVLQLVSLPDLLERGLLLIRCDRLAGTFCRRGREFAASRGRTPPGCRGRCCPRSRYRQSSWQVDVGTPTAAATWTVPVIGATWRSTAACRRPVRAGGLAPQVLVAASGPIPGFGGKRASDVDDGAAGGEAKHEVIPVFVRPIFVGSKRAGAAVDDHDGPGEAVPFAAVPLDEINCGPHAGRRTSRTASRTSADDPGEGGGHDPAPP